MSRATAPAAAGTGFDRRWLALAVTSIGSFMSILDSTIVNIALPGILKDFNADLDNGQLVLTVYLLSLAIVIPVSGFLGERVGMKRLYMMTLAGFTLSSALCGAAWNLPSLIGFRAVQGLAGGMLQPLGMAIVLTMVTPLERGRFMAILGLPMLLGPILGPTLGGYIIETTSWRLIFLINLPIGVLNFGLAWLLLKETPKRAEAKLDARGFALACVAFPAVLLGLSQGERLGWASLPVLGLLVLGAAALALFIVAELRHRDPMLQLRLFAHPMFSLAIVTMFVTQFSLFGLQYILPLFLQRSRGLGPAETGLVLMPTGIAAFFALNVGGHLYNRIGPRPLVIFGMLMLAASNLLMTLVNETTSVVEISAIGCLRGLAMGGGMMPLSTLAFNCVPMAQSARASALVNTVQRLMGSVTTAVLTTLIVLALSWNGAPAGSSITRGTAPVGATFGAFDDTFYIMTAVTALGLALAVFLVDPVLKAAKQAAAGVERAAHREQSLEPAREAAV